MFKSKIANAAWRGLVSFVAFSIPIFVMAMPANIQSLTIGGVLMALAHFAEKKLTS